MYQGVIIGIQLEYLRRVLAWNIFMNRKIPFPGISSESWPGTNKRKQSSSCFGRKPRNIALNSTTQPQISKTKTTTIPTSSSTPAIDKVGAGRYGYRFSGTSSYWCFNSVDFVDFDWLYLLLVPMDCKAQQKWNSNRWWEERDPVQTI